MANPIDSSIINLSVNSKPTSSAVHSLSSVKVEERINYFMGHSIEMLNQLKIQNQVAGKEGENKKIIEIYEKACEELVSIRSKLIGKFASSENQPLDKLKIKELKKELESAKKGTEKIILNAQVEEKKELRSTEEASFETPAKGLRAKFIRFLEMIYNIQAYATHFFYKEKKSSEITTNNQANHILKLYDKDESLDDKNESLGEVDKDKLKELKELKDVTSKEIINRRAGVIGLNGIYFIKNVFSKKEVGKQLKSFTAQNLSQKERVKIEKNILIGETKYASNQIPLNKEFDSHVSSGNNAINVFKKIFGDKGISSANRQEKHLVNGWVSNLKIGETQIFQSLRHAITSDKYEKNNETRLLNSQKAAKELLQAALLQEIQSQGLTLEQAKEKGIVLNLNSVSLVTPDSFRRYVPGQNDEKKMFEDQLKALKSFEGENQEIDLDGISIPVTVKVNAFNFGVNQGAVKHNLGLAFQYDCNKQALDGLQGQYIELARLALEKVGNRRKAELSKREDELSEKIKISNNLMKDINELMENKSAYLKGGNQYEIGAKILNLTNEMDQIAKLISEKKKEENSTSNKEESVGSATPGFKCAFNCMSGKDRTGFLDSVAKTFAILAQQNDGYYPTHKELVESKKQDNENSEEGIYDKFIKTLRSVVLNSGNLEITELNTGAMGLKVGKEARLAKMDKDLFLMIQGLSSTTSS